MSLEIIDVPQNSPEWMQARAGIPTASMFKAILAKGEGKTRRTYMLKLAAEIITGEPGDGLSTEDMERGHIMEPEARNFYAFQKDVEPELVGFIRNGQKGCSPDSLIGADGALEIKTKKPPLMIECLLKDEFPAEHKAQCQGVLWVAEREWIDICVYWPKLQPFIKRAYRDELYIASMSKAVDDFNSELSELVERVRRYGSGGRAAA